MIARFGILRSRYFDSVYLMRVAKRISGADGIVAAAAVIATPKNLAALAQAGFDGAEALGATTADLIVAVKAETATHARAVLDNLEEWLAREPVASEDVAFGTIEEAARAQPGSNLAVISIPGEYAAAEARRALEAGLNVFLFSDNVSLEDEVALKALAADRRLLVMGPDCGTAIIGGTGIGFANVVRRGPIGVVGASGTGTQEVTTLVHRAGSGISHAIGTGSRDLSDAVGGVTTLAAVDLLDADAGTEVIVVVSKPPGPRSLARLRARFPACTKPVVACFLGATPRPAVAGGAVEVGSLDEAARAAVEAAGTSRNNSAGPAPASPADILAARERLGPRQQYIRGVFAGGTLCYQAQAVLQQYGLAVHSNAPLDKRLKLADPFRSVLHSAVDLGDDVFTAGRPHPMIDSTLRSERIRAEGEDPETAVLLIDVVLGYGSAADPAGDILDAIVSARESAARRGGYLPVVASICGTAEDPQSLDEQEARLRSAGALVFSSAARAAAAAAAIVVAT
jgi:FdrA protein